MKLTYFLLILPTAFVLTAAAQTKPFPATGAQTISTDPPSMTKLAFAARGDGVQIYTCEKKQDNWIWQLKEPQATLFDAQEKPIGKHFIGPTWQLDDGSAIHGTLIASQPQVTSIPWLLLSAKQSGGAGALDHISYVRRTDTVGGRAPAQGCDAQHEHAETKVPYSAKYSFYSDAN